MPGHIEDDAIIAAQLKDVGEETARKGSVDARKSSTVSAHGGAADVQEEQTALPIPAKDLQALHAGEDLEDFPSEEDIRTLRRVADYIPPKLFTIAFVEACERFSYYGTVVVVSTCEQCKQCHGIAMCVSLTILQCMSNTRLPDQMIG